MPTLLELTQQGDVGTITDESKLSTITLMDPQQLYELWERQSWISQEIDLTQDVEDWANTPEQTRGELAYTLAAFFVGEERVTTQFSGLVMAYEGQSEEAFLATQQVDEARHAQHFNRFYEQVMQINGTFEDRLSRAREELTEPYIQLFDHHLVEACSRLIEDPSDIGAKVDFITCYHMVIEGMLALTGQWTLTGFLEREGICPGFLEGFKKISQDEHRHVAYGTWFLQQKVAENPALAQRVQDKLVELLPIAAGVLVPPGEDAFGEWELLGFNNEQVNAYAYTALSRRLKVIGIGLPAVTA